MHKGMVTDVGRPKAQRWGLMMAVVLVALIAGSILWWAAASQAGGPIEAGLVVTAPQVDAEERVDETGAMSARALAQYRAFYAEQMASEAVLEQWARPEAPVVKEGRTEGTFYAEQMGSEAALERWASPARGLPSPETRQLPWQSVDGIQFE